MAEVLAEVGEFRLVEIGEKGAVGIQGPAAYLNSEQFQRCLEALEQGRNAVFNYNTKADIWTAVLVAIQTDYAGWVGLQELARQLEGGGAR